MHSYILTDTGRPRSALCTQKNLAITKSDFKTKPNLWLDYIILSSDWIIEIIKSLLSLVEKKSLTHLPTRAVLGGLIALNNTREVKSD